MWGRERGFCLMIGGPDRSVDRLAPLWDTIAPGFAAAERTPGRDGDPAPEERGWLHCGPSGAGHFVKMVHNGIEYGLMAAYAEGLNVLKHANAGTVSRDADAETAPLSDPQFYQYDLDIPAIAEVWRRGSVVGSWLLDLTALALHRSPELDEFSGRVSDSGEGRWTAISAIEEGVPTPVLTAALYERFESQGSGLFANQILSAMRKEFGGHDEKKASARQRRQKGGGSGSSGAVPPREGRHTGSAPISYSRPSGEIHLVIPLRASRPTRQPPWVLS